MPEHPKKKTVVVKKAGKGLKISKRQSGNFKAFQKGFKKATSNFGIKKKDD